MSKRINPAKIYTQHAIPDLQQVELKVTYVFEATARVDAHVFKMLCENTYLRLESDLKHAIAEWGYDAY